MWSVGRERNKEKKGEMLRNVREFILHSKGEIRREKCLKAGET